MRTAVTIAVACAALAASAAATAGPAGETSLRVAYWEGGSGGIGATPDSVWTLRCEPPRGTLRRPALACQRLEAGGTKLFAPISPKVACTQIYGGPQRARVTGLLDGRRVWAIFSRSDGCQIARWARVSPWLLPPGGAT